MRRLHLPLLAVIVVPIGCTTAGLAPNYTPWGRPSGDEPRAHAIAHYLAAVVYAQRGDAARARAESERSVELDPAALTPTLQLVRAYLRDRNFDKALEMAERAVQQQPDRANLHIVLGEIYHHVRRFDDAVRAFERAIALNPDNALGYGALAEVQENTNDLVAAADIYQRLAEMNPGNAALQMQYGLALARMRDNAGARAALAAALERDPKLSRARYLLGVLGLEAGADAEAALHLEEHVAQRPRDRDGKEALAAALTRLGRHDEAAALYRAVIDFAPIDSPGPDAADRESEAAAPIEAKQYLLAMYERLAAGKPAEAEALAPPTGAPFLGTVFRAIARQDQQLPHQPLLESLDATEGSLDDECTTWLADLVYAFGKERFGGWLLPRIEAFADAPGARHTIGILRGRLLLQLERWADAAAEFERWAAAPDPDPMLHQYLATAYQELDDFARTEQHLKAYLERRPDDPDMLNFLGYHYAEYGVKLDEARQLLDKALAIDPNNPFYLDSLGWVYFKNGKADEAIDHIQRAIYGMETDDAVLRDHLGDAYLLKGDPARAVAEWERARRLDPKLEGVQEKIDRHRQP